MTDSVRSQPPTGGNGTFFQCDRGWNDPPKHVFSPTNAGRKRIDPRKRVAHDLTSSSFQQPAVQPQPYPNGAAVQPTYPDHYMPPPSFNNMPNTAPPSNFGLLPHATSNPDISASANGNVITQLPQDPHSNSMPFNIPAHDPNNQYLVNNGVPSSNAHQQPRVLTPPINGIPPQPTPQLNNAVPPSINAPLPQPGYFVPPAQLSGLAPLNFGPPQAQPSDNKPLVQPLYIAPQLPSSQPRNTAPYLGMPLVTKDGSQDGRKLSAPKNNLTNSIFDQMSTPTMLQSSHLANKLGNMEISSVPKQNNAASTSPHLIPKVQDNQARVSPTNVMTGPQVYPQPNQSMNTNIGAPPTIIGAPPTNGFYVGSKIANGTNSPKNTSPYSSLQNTPEVNQNKSILPNDLEILNEVAEKLSGVLNKCSCVMTNKIADEINKKVHIFKTSWTSGKLSNNVKLQMSTLSKALDSCEFNQADSIHKSLIVSNSGEVMSWMIGIKKLITSYQKVVEENNKY